VKKTAGALRLGWAAGADVDARTTRSLADADLKI
jgi:hypothetical protein